MKKQILSSVFAVLATVSAASAYASGDCRLKLVASTDVTNFADVDTFQTALDISNALKDRKHGFVVSNDADAPYVLEYRITANGADKRAVQAGYSINFNGGGMKLQGGGSTVETARKEKNQVKLYNKIVNDLMASLPACPYR